MGLPLLPYEVGDDDGRYKIIKIISQEQWIPQSHCHASTTINFGAPSLSDSITDDGVLVAAVAANVQVDSVADAPVDAVDALVKDAADDIVDVQVETVPDDDSTNYCLIDDVPADVPMDADDEIYPLPLGITSLQLADSRISTGVLPALLLPTSKPMLLY